MTHFVALVILPKGIKGKTNIELAVLHTLAPYDEHNEAEPFVCHTVDEIMKKRTENIRDIKKNLADDKRNDERWRESAKKRIEELKNETDQKFYDDYVGGSLLDEDGNMMATYNPDGHWDWWVIGGRWKNYLNLKDGKHADFAKVKEVRFEPTEDELKLTGDRYERLKNTDTMKKQGIALDKDVEIEYMFSEFDPTQSKEEFIEEEMATSFYCCIDKNGEWHERTDYYSAEERREWRLKFKERFIDPLDPNDILVVVDCHS
jgi:hypothetical protein